MSNEQCKTCFHRQVCVCALKKPMFIKEDVDCQHYVPTSDIVRKSEIVEEIFGELLKISTAEGAYDYASSWDIAELREKYRRKEETYG